MRLITFASGSTGNCALLSDGDTHILLDAGISMKRTVACLADCGLKPHDLSGVLITHEHSDHISGLKMLVKHYRLRIFAPNALALVLREQLPELSDCIEGLELGCGNTLGKLTVTPFRTPHDAKYSVGYRIEGSAVFALATDTGTVTKTMLDHLCGADMAVIESNHDLKMLKYGPYPQYLKLRILSDRGHLSNDACAALARTLAESGAKQLVLAHLSRENNTPELAFTTVKNGLTGLDTALSVAPMAGLHEVSVC